MKTDTILLGLLTVAVLLAAWLSWRNFENTIRADRAEASELAAWKQLREERTNAAEAWKLAQEIRASVSQGWNITDKGE